jgi:hypothetical protein
MLFPNRRINSIQKAYRQSILTFNAFSWSKLFDQTQFDELEVQKFRRKLVLMKFFEYFLDRVD